MTTLESAELYAKDKHKTMTRNDKVTPYSAHLEAVVNRLKGLGVTNEDILCAGWLHDILEDTSTTFDDIYDRFGKHVAVLVSSLSKDQKLAKKEKEIQYVKQLKVASFEAKLIKLCDISANLKDLENSGMSKTKRKKTVNQKLHYLRVIKNEISERKAEFPKVSLLVDGINQIAKNYHQKLVTF